MEQKYLILSDIHGNISAFNSILAECKEENFAGIILLGDCIDYGMRSNETISMLQELLAGTWKDKVLVNIWGNHEQLLVEKNLERLSSDRGREIAKYTADHMTSNSLTYINEVMNHSGKALFTMNGFKCLAVHGSLEDYYWKAISPDNVRFINSGSVGQPRNQNPCAQYAVLSLPSKRVELRCVPYDVEFEQSLFPDSVDAFYKTRLTKGI